MDDNKTTAIEAGDGTATDQQQVPEKATEQPMHEETTAVEETPPVDAPKPVKPAQKTYSQAEYDRMIKSQYEAGIAATMKEAGYEPTRGADFKKQLAAFKKWQDDQKTDAELASEAAEKTQRELKDALAKAETLERQMLALGLGVPADKVGTYVHMAAMYLAESEGRFRGVYHSPGQHEIRGVEGKVPAGVDGVKSPLPPGRGQGYNPLEH